MKKTLVKITLAGVSLIGAIVLYGIKPPPDVFVVILRNMF